MNPELLKAEMEKRIKELPVSVRALNDENNTEITMYRIRIPKDGHSVERMVSYTELQRVDLPHFLDSVALYLIYDWAFQRYYRRLNHG